MRRTLLRGVTLAVLALALLSLQGCAADGRNPDRDPGIDKRYEPWDHPPGFTPFSA